LTNHRRTQRDNRSFRLLPSAKECVVFERKDTIEIALEVVL
jgi:hypothetical protein